MRNQRYVGRRHLEIAQLVRPDPRKPLTFLSSDRSLPTPADIEGHQKMKVGIAVAREGQWREARLADDDSEFLPQLSDQRLFRPFARFDLATGKFPKARHRLAFRPLCNQHAAVGIDQRAGGDQNELHVCNARIIGGRG